MAPVLVEPHKDKSREEVKRVREADRKRRAHIGAANPSKTKIKSRGFPKKSTREPKIPLPPRKPIYER
jgi:hypothetical protein